MLPRGAVANPTPAPAVPDLVAVVYEHADAPEARATTDRHSVATHGHVPTIPPITPKDFGFRPPGGMAAGWPGPRSAAEIHMPGSPSWEGPAGRGSASWPLGNELAGRGGDSWHLGEWEPSWTAADHAAAVSAVRDAIGRGDVYQVNVVGHASAAYVGDPLPGPGAGSAGCREPATAACSPARAGRSAAPPRRPWCEVVDGRVVTRPIKGTRPATEAGRRELLDSAKERAEHIMIVDLERNDLARVARTGSVRVDELFAIRRWVDLWQAESVVSADLADGIGLADLLRATCPGGSVTGAPKLAALERIAALEPVGRGPSMGALGWIDASGDLDLGLTIRTAAADADRLHLWAGGGITWDSDPEAEVAEAAAKAAPIRRLLASS